MARKKARKNAVLKNDNYDLRTRRSSMMVNLSFVSNLSDSVSSRTKVVENGKAVAPLDTDGNILNAAKGHRKKRHINDDSAMPESVASITVIAVNNKEKALEDVDSDSVTDISEKEQQLTENCSKLKDAIISKAKALFEGENELTRKMSQVFAEYVSLHDTDDSDDKRSPSIRVDLGKNDQIVMSGDGKKKNPVQVNSMKDGTTSSQKNDEVVDCSQSIASTPKKARTKHKVDNKTPDTVLSIPVTRLFSDNNDPNDSMSQVNPMNSQNTLTTSHEINENELSNTIEIATDLNYSTSPILSQGIRKSKISRLSLKRKLSTLDPTESFINRAPLTCSSFIEKKSLNNNDETEKIDDTINLDDKSKSSSCKTIDLDGENNSKTINIDNSSSRSSMDITAVSSNHTPIIRRPFQHSIRKSLNLGNRVFTNETTQKPTSPSQKQTLNSGKSKSSNSIESTQQKSKSSDEGQQDCSINTVRTSLNVNTSMDNLNSADSVMQKENKKPNNTEEEIVETAKVDDTVIIQRQNTSVSSKFISPRKKSLRLNLKNITKNQGNGNEMGSSSSSSKRIRTSLQVNTSLDSVMKSSTSKNFNQEQIKSIEYEPSKNSTESRSSTTSTVRSSMQVNTSLDSARKSPITNTKLDYHQILSMVEETSQKDNQNQESNYSLNNKSLTSDSDLENAPLMERMRKIPTSMKIERKKNKNLKKLNEESETKNVVPKDNKTDETENISLNVTESSSESRTKRSRLIENSYSSIKRKFTEETFVNKRKPEDELNGSSKRNCKETEKVSCKRTLLEDSDSDCEEKSPETKKVNSKRKSANINNSHSDKRRSTRGKNVSSTSNESSVIETTPYPTSRSMLFKTMIKNSIAMNTLDARKLAISSESEDFSDSEETSRKKKISVKKTQRADAKKKTSSPELTDVHKNTTSDELSDTVILNSSDEVSSSELQKEKEPVIINESLNKMSYDSKSKDIKKLKTNKNENYQVDKKGTTKRKLYPLRDNSELVSFSPADIPESPRNREAKTTKTKKMLKKRNFTQKKRPEKVSAPVESEPVEEVDTAENKEIPVEETKKKKPRKIIRKKIVVKKVTNLTLLDNLLDKEEQKKSERLSERSSLGEFDLRKMKSKKVESNRKSHRIIIVVTGLTTEDRDLVKSVIKKLGSAVLEQHVTPRTTHVISSGYRTTNLMKAIIRGCWLLSLEWALKSLESEKWLDPAPYEMSHFAKAVQENRRDRKLFGKAYVPELFVTCGPIYIESKSSPPPATLKELVKIAGGRIIEDCNKAEIVVGSGGLREGWILDSITTGELQPVDQYQRS